MKEIKLKKEPGCPVIYINEETGKGLVVQRNRKVSRGSVQIKKGEYRYFQYRQGKKIITKYLGRI